MINIAWETVLQIALRNCSKDVGWKVSVYVVLLKGEYMQSNTYFLQKISTSLMKTTANHKEQISP